MDPNHVYDEEDNDCFESMSEDCYLCCMDADNGLYYAPCPHC